MFRGVCLCLASLVSWSCGGGSGDDDPGVDAPISMACMEATTYQDLGSIEDKIFKASCVFSGCHNGGATDAGMMDLRAGMSHADLVGVPSRIENGQTIVTAGNPAASYLLVMIGEIPPGQAVPPTVDPPSEIGFMPQGTGGVLLCAEKRGAIARWITNGAMND